MNKALSANLLQLVRHSLSNCSCIYNDAICIAARVVLQETINIADTDLTCGVQLNRVTIRQLNQSNLFPTMFIFISVSAETTTVIDGIKAGKQFIARVYRNRNRCQSVKLPTPLTVVNESQTV